MNCCFPSLSKLTELCQICYNPCSVFEIKIIENDIIICDCCYHKCLKSRLDPDYKLAQTFSEKYKWYSDNELYSIRGPYVLNKWNKVVGDIVNNNIQMRTFLNEECYLCKGQVSTLKETYINGYIYHYECAKLII